MRLPGLGLTFVVGACALVGCGGSNEIKAAGYTLDVGDSAYFSYDNAQACPHGGLGELVLDFVDYNYLCDPHHASTRNPASSHVELKIIVTIGPAPDYAGSFPTLHPYEVGPADCDNGPTSPAIAQMIHYPAGDSSGNTPDAIKQADSGSVQFTTFKADKSQQLKGVYELHFGSDVVKSSFALDSCN